MRFLLALTLIAASPSHTIQRDRAVGPVRIGSGTLSQARAAYGEPTNLIRRRGTCFARWRPLHLSMQFLEFSGDPCTSGVLVFAIASGRSWQTDRGLHVGASRARLLTLYPNAKAKPDGRWLITRRACQDVGGNLFAGLKARMANRHVSALVVSANIC